MVRPLDIADFLEGASPIIDVRSPKEFAQGHIPGAHSLPLFTDDERAVVGTLYKQQGRDPALLQGLRIVGPKLAAMVEEARALAPDGRIRVHCWRGGERSGSVAWLLDKAGFAEVITLRKGYKAFRNHVLVSFAAPLPLNVLGGYTGTGKTELLGHLRRIGEQVIDLETLANHKGSSFGALGEQPQPTTEHFENLLWNELRQVDRSRALWLEDESIMIGRCKIPQALFDRMQVALLYFVEMEQEQRAQRLVKHYGAFPKEQLAEAIKRIEKRMGPQHCKAALNALEDGDLKTVAMITLTYYDKAYRRGTETRDARTLLRLPLSNTDLAAAAQMLVAQPHGRARQV
jgi:tRNA 2-selenouridine synthase